MYLNKCISNKFIMKINISNNNAYLYESILIFLNKICQLKTDISELITVYKNNHYIDVLNKENHIFLPQLEQDKIYSCMYKDVDILVHETKGEENFVASRSKIIINKKFLHLNLDTENNELLTEMFDDVYKFMQNDYKQIESDFITHYIFNDYQEWEKNDFYQKRNIETLYLPQHTKMDLFDDVYNFYYNEDICKFYQKMKIPQTRIYLLYGYPGTGKTTTSFVIASKLNLNICSLDFTNKIDDLVLRKSIKNIPENSLFLIEDIDHLFLPQKSHDDTRHSITFSGLLNILDGISKVKKLIIIITCNRIDVLDKTFLRRIDYSVKFENGVSEDQLKSFCNELPFEIDTNKFCNFFKNKETTMNVIQKWVLYHLNKLIKKEKKMEEILNTFIEFNKWYQNNTQKIDLYN